MREMLTFFWRVVPAGAGHVSTYLSFEILQNAAHEPNNLYVVAFAGFSLQKVPANGNLNGTAGQRVGDRWEKCTKNVRFSVIKIS